MLQQPELDLQQPECPPPLAKPGPRFAGLTRGQLVIAAVLLMAFTWSIWVTKALVSPRPERFVTVRLSSLLGEYLQAQAHASTPPAQVQAEMKAFMSGLDIELQRRGAAGQVVLVGEAVLTKNVPDITDSLRAAVYASGVRMPRRASPAPGQPGPDRQIERVSEGRANGDTAFSAQAKSGESSAHSAQLDDAVSAFSGPSSIASTFGGPDDDGGR